jgi:hypothetical protein
MGRRGSDRGEDETRAGAPLVVDATLLDTGAPAPKPGIVYVVSLMHYGVLGVVRGAYPHSSIFVGHSLPNLASGEFRVGTRHRLYLTKLFPEHASVLDAFQTDVSKTLPFFCSSFEVLAPAPGAGRS